MGILETCCSNRNNKKKQKENDEFSTYHNKKDPIYLVENLNNYKNFINKDNNQSMISCSHLLLPFEENQGLSNKYIFIIM